MFSENYITLTENVTNKKEALIVANTTFHPYILAERSQLLLFDFITRFLDNKEAREQLIAELQIDDGALIRAHLFGIYEHIAAASLMLKECQTLTMSEDKNDAHNSKHSK